MLRRQNYFSAQCLTALGETIKYNAERSLNCVLKARLWDEYRIWYIHSSQFNRRRNIMKTDYKTLTCCSCIKCTSVISNRVLCISVHGLRVWRNKVVVFKGLVIIETIITRAGIIDDDGMLLSIRPFCFSKHLTTIYCL